MTLLRVEDLVTKYGEIPAVKGISFEVQEGEIVALIGANGAGKSTTLLTISGALKPSSGKIIFEGKELQGLPAHDIANLGIMQCPEGKRLFTTMTVEENLLLGHYTRRKAGNPADPMRRVFKLFPILEERFHQSSGTLSGGERQMLAMGRAMMAQPRLLMLDEPSLGLAPKLVETVLDTIKHIHDEGTTVLLVEQNARAALSMADRAYVLEVGSIAMEGTGQQLLNDERVRRAYLGGQVCR
jgi:branched-chain amino acid transport system ATP-binding protein